MITLKRFWLRFAQLPQPTSINLGCGVTAYSQEDATRILKNIVFAEHAMPAIVEVIENVDISTLDQGHVIPNMSPPNIRGVWFPKGY